MQRFRSITIPSLAMSSPLPSVQMTQDRHRDDLFPALQRLVQLIGLQTQTVHHNREIAAQPALTYQIVVETATIKGFEPTQQFGHRCALKFHPAPAEPQHLARSSQRGNIGRRHQILSTRTRALDSNPPVALSVYSIDPVNSRLKWLPFFFCRSLVTKCRVIALLTPNTSG